MNIEDMQKIWNAQEQKAYYVIDEERLFDQIKRRAKRIDHAVNRDEIGLIIISVLSVGILFITKPGDFFTFATMAMLIAVGIYVFIARKKRIKSEEEFDLTMIDHVDQAISQTKYRIRSARSFIWWYILPLAVPTFGNMLTSDNKAWWQWVLVPTAFTVSYFMVRNARIKRFEPGLRKLEKIREQLEDAA